MSAAANMIKSDPRLIYLPEDTEYKMIFAQSDLILTDFSSIAFDFAYLRKPIVYYQEDIGDFYSGAHSYDKGYFEYERDGFGEVIFDGDVLIECLIDYMQNGCQLKPKYRARIDATFRMRIKITAGGFMKKFWCWTPKMGMAGHDVSVGGTLIFLPK